MSVTFLPSRTGASFLGRTEVEDDGTFTVLTASGSGERSAHRDAAAAHFGTRSLDCKGRMSWLNLHGVRVTLTHWTPKEKA